MFWPSAGVAVATLTLTRYGMWPLIALLMLAVELAVPRLLAGAEIVSFASPATVIEPVLGAFLLRVTVGPSIDVSRFRHAFALVILAGLIATGFAALIGAYQVTAVEPDLDFLSAWQVWWFGSALGVMVIAPVILSWASRPAGTALAKERLPEALVLGTAIVLAGVLVLDGPPRPFRSILDFPFVTFPLLFGPRFASMSGSCPRPRCSSRSSPYGAPHGLTARS